MGTLDKYFQSGGLEITGRTPVVTAPVVSANTYIYQPIATLSNGDFPVGHELDIDHGSLDLRFGRNQRARINASANNTYATVCNVTGSGYMLLAISQVDSRSFAPPIRMWLDGTSYEFSTTSGRGMGIGAVTRLDSGNIGHALIHKDIDFTNLSDGQKKHIASLCGLGFRFETSMKIEIFTGTGGTNRCGGAFYVFDDEI